MIAIIGGPAKDKDKKNDSPVLAIGLKAKPKSPLKGIGGGFSKADESDEEDGASTMDAEAKKKEAAVEILSAVESKNVKQLSSALQAFFNVCDAEPHQEGGSISGDGADETDETKGD